MGATNDRRWFAIGIAGGLLAVGIAAVVVGPGGLKSESEPSRNFTATDLGVVARLAATAYTGDTAPPTQSERTAQASEGISAVVRANGRACGTAWSDGGTLGGGIVRAVSAARDACDEEHRTGANTIELCLARSFHGVQADRIATLGNDLRGILGVELSQNGRIARATPTWMIAENASFAGVAEGFRRQSGVSPDPSLAGAEARVFRCDQLLVLLEPEPRAVLMIRGNQVVELGQVARESVRAFERTASDWLIRNVHDDGRMTYRYWPSRGTEAPGNNMIRQWMASVALARIGKRRGDPALVALAAKNIAYNLEHYYREEGGLGLIDWQDEVKLGAIALAAQAIVEHPERSRFFRQEAALLRTVDHLQQTDGSFLTFYQPVRRRGENQNFYPGETLLLWATLHQERRDPRLLEKIVRSFRYYRDWHRRNRNPAFVPWHTQAYVLLWQSTRDRELAEFVFEMNDWLLSMQQWESAPFPDTQGRFFDPKRPEFGPPHASSTGVYLEGLIDAYRLAVDLRDERRADAYRRAILRGLRHAMQLQFTDAIDLFYVFDRQSVLGGLRTRVYDNTIRVDNVQHNLLAAQKILDTFEPEDYRLP